jgi:acyl-coenzyme A synthetase/AMP-(fatty) acid ligase
VLSGPDTDLFSGIKDQPIGLWCDKTASAIQNLLSIVRSGNAYLPLNPEWPSARIRFIIIQTKLQACIVEEKYSDQFVVIVNESGLSFKRTDLKAGYSFYKIEQAPLKYPKEIAYILFTSGSTGFPKGIIHDAVSASAFLKWCSKEFKKYKLKRFVSIAPLNFDLSVFDILYPVVNGGTIFLPASGTISNPRAFAQYLVKNKIEVIYTTPSYLKLLMVSGHLHKHNLNPVKLILCAGEQLNYELAGKLKEYFKKAVVYNLYGPTETNVCTYFKIKEGKNLTGNVPIGKPCYKNEIRISREGGLIYKGDLLMKGFIDENGIHKVKGSFRTGDLVKKLKSGDLEFIGRKDKMIKRNGFRIEPGEIKSALLKFRGVENCEIVTLKKENIQIIAFVQSPGTLSELELKTFCLQLLPAYMLPDRVVCVLEIPLNLNHKADIDKLLRQI